MRTPKDKLTNPGIFVFMVFLFTMSVSLIAYGIFQNLGESEEMRRLIPKEIGDVTEDKDHTLSKYFENNLSTNSLSGRDDYYLQTDPFKDTCSAGEGGKIPFVISGTVCYR